MEREPKDAAFREKGMTNKWIVTKGPNDDYLLKCSSCGFSLTSYEGENPADRGLYHCPWCGTRLIDLDREGENES